MDTAYYIDVYEEGLRRGKAKVAEALEEYRKKNNLTPKDEFYNGPWYSRWTALGFTGRKKSDKLMKELAAVGFVKHDSYWGWTLDTFPNFDKGAQSAVLADIGYRTLKEYLEKNTDLICSIHERDL